MITSHYRLVLILAGCAVACLGAGELRYSLTEIDSLGRLTSYGTTINNAGQIVGRLGETSDAGSRLFIYANGVTILLPAVGDGAGANSCTINELGLIIAIGYSSADGSDHAYSIWNGQVTDLGKGAAYTANSSGAAPGWSPRADGAHEACLFTGGGITLLGNLGGNGSVATGINDNGLVVGQSNVPFSPRHPFLYSNGVMTDINSWFIAGDVMPNCVNNAGQFVGTVTDIELHYHPFSCLNGQVTYLTTQSAMAYRLNEAGDIVGLLVDPVDNTHGFLYKDGVMHDLNDLMDSTAAGWVVSYGMDINDAGVIAGLAFRTNARSQQRAVVLTPLAGIEGSAILQNYAASVAGTPVEIELRDPGSANVVQKKVVLLKADGSFTLNTTLKGTFDVTAKGAHWLRKKLPSETLTGEDFTGSINFSLVNGDVNGDNAINLPDLTAISLAWRTTPGMAKWNPNADLNGDGSVNLSDWTIASMNWRKSGDR